MFVNYFQQIIVGVTVIWSEILNFSSNNNHFKLPITKVKKLFQYRTFLSYIFNSYFFTDEIR